MGSLALNKQKKDSMDHMEKIKAMKSQWRMLGRGECNLNSIVMPQRNGQFSRELK